MSAVRDERGAIIAPEVKPYREVAKGYTYFEEGDVLFAKITPCMENGKSAIATGLVDRVGFGSTEFHVLRPGLSVCAEWLHLFIRRPIFRDEAARYFTGAVGQQRVPEEFVARSLIPLPPLAEQRRIAARLSEQMAQVESMRQAARAQVEAARALPAAFLREVFESEGAKKWPRRRLGELGDTVSKGTTPTTYGHAFTQKGVPFLRAEDVNGGPVDIDAVTFHISEQTHRFLLRSQMKPGDLLITIAGTLGRVGYVPDDAGPLNCNQAVAFARLKPSMARVQFVCLALQAPAIIAPLLKLIAGGTIKNLNLQQVRNVEVPLPALDEQQHIVARLSDQMAQVEKARHAARAQVEAINALSGALLEEVFGGFEPPAQAMP